jgi:hypothetical protein
MGEWRYGSTILDLCTEGSNCLTTKEGAPGTVWMCVGLTTKTETSSMTSGIELATIWHVA